VRVVGSAAQRLVSDERSGRELSWTTGGMGWMGVREGRQLAAAVRLSWWRDSTGEHNREEEAREDERGDLLDSCSQFCSEREVR
jgi:hypothetical protein